MEDMSLFYHFDPRGFSQPLIGTGVFLFRSAILPVPFNLQGECEMMLPQTISGWCMWLYFLWVGIGAFVALPLFGVIAGILALGYAIASLFGR
jgi:hypothetical protein